MKLILNPQIRLQKNSNRILIYKIDEYLQTPLEIQFLHPIFAILLTMFDGKKSHEEVWKNFCFVIDKEYNEESIKFIQENLEHIQTKLLKIDNLLVDVNTITNQTSPRYNPEDFIIHADNINLDPHNRRIDFPLSLNYNVATSCSLNCIYCYHPKYRVNEFISLERLNQLFDEAKANGLESVTLSGGDPFDRTEITDIMSMLYEKGISYFISTKSYLGKKLCEYMAKECGLDRMQISLDSADPQIASGMVGGPKDFLERTIQTAKNLIECGVNVRFKAVLTSYNIDQMNKYIEMCKTLGIDIVQLVAYGRSIWNHEDKIFPTNDQMERYNDFLHKFRQNNKFPNIIGGSLSKSMICSDDFDRSKMWEKRSVCNAGRFGLTMLPNGEVSICEQLGYSSKVILGDLRRMSISELWNSPRVAEWLSPPPRDEFEVDSPCYTCTEDNYMYCHQFISRCIRDTYNCFSKLNAPDIRCPLAQVTDFRLS